MLSRFADETGLQPNEIAFIANLNVYTNVILVMTKADLLTPPKIERLRSVLLEQIHVNRLTLCKRIQSTNDDSNSIFITGDSLDLTLLGTDDPYRSLGLTALISALVDGDNYDFLRKSTFTKQQAWMTKSRAIVTTLSIFNRQTTSDRENCNVAASPEYRHNAINLRPSFQKSEMDLAPTSIPRSEANATWRSAKSLALRSQDQIGTAKRSRAHSQCSDDYRDPFGLLRAKETWGSRIKQAFGWIVEIGFGIGFSYMVWSSLCAKLRYPIVL